VIITLASKQNDRRFDGNGLPLRRGYFVLAHLESTRDSNAVRGLFVGGTHSVTGRTSEHEFPRRYPDKLQRNVVCKCGHKRTPLLQGRSERTRTYCQSNADCCNDFHFRIPTPAVESATQKENQYHAL
jgi:hypothetical protein